MNVIGVTSRSLRGYVAGCRGYVALSRGYVARSGLNPLFFLRFFNCFRPLPFFYPLSTSSPCGQLLASPTPTACNRRWPAPSARRATGSPTLWAGESYRTGPYRLGGYAASLYGAANTSDARERRKSFAGMPHRQSNRPWPEAAPAASPSPVVSFSLGQGPSGPRQARKGYSREEPVDGCGTPADRPGLSTPSRCGQRSRPRAGASATHDLSFTTLLRPLAGA